MKLSLKRPTDFPNENNGSIAPDNKNKPLGNCEDCSGDDIVERVDNKIYFYSEVDRRSIFKFNKLLDAVTSDNINTAVKCGLTTKENFIPVNVYIDSHGGEVIRGLSAFDNIRYCEIPVVTIVDGYCMSAATLLLLGGNLRLMNENAVILIHQLSSFSAGTYRQMKDDFENSTMLMEKLTGIYEQRTKLSQKDLKHLLNHDLYLDAKKAKKLGFVDEIISDGSVNNKK